MSKKGNKANQKAAEKQAKVPAVSIDQEPLARPEPKRERPRSAAPRDREPAPGLNLPAWGRDALLGVLLFFLLAFKGGGDNRTAAVAVAVLFLVLGVGRHAMWSLRRRLSWPVLAVCLYFLINFAASLYARFGSFAGSEFSKILAAFCLFMLVVLRVREGEGRQMAAILSCVTAAFSLVSIDASSLGALSKVYVGLMDRLGCSYSNLSIGYERGTRITGVFGNANILAGILAFGVFLSLYLLLEAENRRAALGASILLAVNAVGFLLAFSMGAIGMFVPAALVYLLLASKERRLPTFLLMAETAVLSLISLFVAFPGLGASGAAAAVPVLTPLLAGVALWALHWFVGRRAAELVGHHGRAAGVVIGGAVLLLGAYVALAYQLAGSYSLAPGEQLRRSVYPEPGTYTLEGKWSGSPSVLVESQNEYQTITHTSDVLYRGGLEGASFTVPEGAQVVYLIFSDPEGAALERVALSTGPEVKLGYTLLPGFVANRIQGLWANQNAIQRGEFFRDGLRIYALSPVFGSGLGSVDGLVTSVQRFYYESRYVHNHYIQALAEMGIPGLLSFLAIIGTSALTLWKRRREGNGDPLLAALGACLAMTALHAATEAVWSTGVYQVMALLILALIAVFFGRPPARLSGQNAAWCAMIALWLVVAGAGWLMYGHVSALGEYQEVKAGEREQTPYTMTALARRDRYNWSQYKLDMAVNAAESEVPQFAQTAAEYAAQLRKLKIQSINYSLEAYHYWPLGQYDQLFQASREGLRQVASRAEAWQGEFDLYQEVLTAGGAEVLDRAPWFADQVLLTLAQLDEWNASGRLETVALSEKNLAFLDQVRAIGDSGATGDAAAALLGLAP